ncbi:hypothetical protein [Rhodospirillaceae bacterium SYSU D60014]|uniref:hypothetical protein n=1 Tax=Virgifigura deserti TaxID=2268457 RepID=UPI000E66BD5E
MAKGGSNTTTQTSEPWSEQIPYLKNIFSEAERLYTAPGPNHFPGTTVAPFAPETELALNAQAARAMAGSPLTRVAGEALGDTLSGGYLGANPYLQGAIDSAGRGVVRNYRNAVTSGIDSSFAQAGRYGSGAHVAAHSNAQQNLAQQLADISSGMSYQNYGDERARMQQAATAAPGLAQQDYLDIAQLAAVGRAREGMAQNLIDDQVARFNFAQQLPYNKLAQYAGLIQGNYGGTSTTTQSSGGAGPLGGAATGFTLGGQVGGPWGAAIGAGLGGLLSLW